MDSPSLLGALSEVCLSAGERAMKARESLQRELKSDGSVVTNADRAVEEYLRQELPRLVSGTTVWGEELGFEEEGPGGLWVVDPIDGTTNFAYGSPAWGISVGLVHGDAIEVGAIFLPDYGDMFLTSRGGGATCNGEPLAAIPPGPIRQEEPVSFNDSVIRTYGLENLPFKMRCSGAAVIDGTNVARQRFRAFIGFRESLYDIAPAMLMGMELGADVRYADGMAIEIAALKRPVKMDRAWLIFPAGTEFRLG